MRRWLDIEGVVRQILADSTPSADPELEGLAGRVEALEKKVKMIMGGVQASGAQLMGLHSSVDQLKAQAAQAAQQATTARSTAESAADGVEGLDERLSALMERIGAAAS